MERGMADTGNHQDARVENEIDFGDAADPEGAPSVQTTIAFETHRVRMIVAIATLVIFLVINGMVLLGINEALQFDFRMLAASAKGYERFITATVISSILGATTIQLGAIMFTITKFFFPVK
jgi:hypothetical protein